MVTIPGDAKGASSAMLEPKAIVEPEKSDVKREEIEASKCSAQVFLVLHTSVLSLIEPVADVLR